VNARDLIAAARYRATRPDMMPYLSSVLLSLRPVEVPGLGTVGVDAGWRLYYDPKVIESWGVFSQADDGVTVVLLHEALHCALHFHERLGARDPQIFNVAQDCSINEILVEAGLRLPAFKHDSGLEGAAVLPSTFGLPPKLTAEEYYNLLLKQAIKTPSHKCGGCAGNPHDCEQGQGSPLDSGIEGISPLDQQLLRRATAEAVQQHGKHAGNLPGALKAWADIELAPPKVDWRKQLASLVRCTLASAAGQSDYTYRRPARRQWGLRAVFGSRSPIMPALRAPIPTVKGVLDVSGSMIGAPALAARAELMGICKALGSPVEWVSCDTQIAARARVGSKRDIGKLGDTQGGTALDVAIRQLDRERPDVVIVLTDGYTGWGNRGDYRCRLLAAITPHGQKPPDWVPWVQIEE